MDLWSSEAVSQANITLIDKGYYIKDKVNTHKTLYRLKIEEQFNRAYPFAHRGDLVIPYDFINPYDSDINRGYSYICPNDVTISQDGHIGVGLSPNHFEMVMDTVVNNILDEPLFRVMLVQELVKLYLSDMIEAKYKLLKMSLDSKTGEASDYKDNQRNVLRNTTDQGLKDLDKYLDKDIFNFSVDRLVKVAASDSRDSFIKRMIGNLYFVVRNYKHKFREVSEFNADIKVTFIQGYNSKFMTPNIGFYNTNANYGLPVKKIDAKSRSIVLDVSFSNGEKEEIYVDTFVDWRCKPIAKEYIKQIRDMSQKDVNMRVLPEIEDAYNNLLRNQNNKTAMHDLSNLMQERVEILDFYYV